MVKIRKSKSELSSLNRSIFKKSSTKTLNKEPFKELKEKYKQFSNSFNSIFKKNLRNELSSKKEIKTNKEKTVSLLPTPLNTTKPDVKTSHSTTKLNQPKSKATSSKSNSSTTESTDIKDKDKANSSTPAPSTKAGKKIAARMQKPIKTIEKEKTIDPFKQWGNKIESTIKEKVDDVIHLSTMSDHLRSHFNAETISNKDEYRTKVKEEVNRNLKTLDFIADSTENVSQVLEETVILPSVETLGNLTAKTINEFNKDSSAEQVSEKEYGDLFKGGYKFLTDGVPFLIRQAVTPVVKDTIGETLKEQVTNLSNMVDAKDSEGQILRQEVVHGIIDLGIEKIVKSQSKEAFQEASSAFKHVVEKDTVNHRETGTKNEIDSIGDVFSSWFQ